MRIGRWLGAALVAIVLVAGGACGSDDPGTDRADEPTTPAAPINAKRCLKLQQYGTWPARDRLQVLTSRVLANADEQAPGAAERFAKAIGNAARQASRACGEAATELNGVAELAGSAAEDGLDEAGLREMVDAFEAWGTAIRRERDTRIVFSADPCVDLLDAVDVSYRIHRRPEPGGMRAWVEIMLVNGWSEEVYMEHSGRIEATGVRPDGGSQSFDWGGSSSDSAGARPGRTSTNPVYPVPAAGPEPYLHLFPGGEVRAFDVSAWVSTSIGPCPTDVEPGP